MKTNSIVAEFFVIGLEVEKQPGRANRIVIEGHTIQNHSWSHPDLKKASESDVRSQLTKTQSAIKPLPGAATLTFASIGVPAGTDFADLNLTGNRIHAGFHAGLLVKPHPRFSLGARFLSGQTVDVTDGELETQQVSTGLVTQVPLPGIPAGTFLDSLIAPAFAAGGPLSTGQQASTTLPLPAQFVAGAAIDATNALRLFADYQFTNWRTCCTDRCRERRRVQIPRQPFGCVLRLQVLNAVFRLKAEATCGFRLQPEGSRRCVIT